MLTHSFLHVLLQFLQVPSVHFLIFFFLFLRRRSFFIRFTVRIWPMFSFLLLLFPISFRLPNLMLLNNAHKFNRRFINKYIIRGPIIIEIRMITNPSSLPRFKTSLWFTSILIFSILHRRRQPHEDSIPSFLSYPVLKLLISLFHCYLLTQDRDVWNLSFGRGIQIDFISGLSGLRDSLVFNTFK